MGSGKTVTGQRLAQILVWKFSDIDEIVSAPNRLKAKLQISTWLVSPVSELSPIIIGIFVSYILHNPVGYKSIRYPTI